VHKVGAKGKPVKERTKGEGEAVLSSLCGKDCKRKDSLAKHVRFVHEKRFSSVLMVTFVGWEWRVGGG